MSILILNTKDRKESVLSEKEIVLFKKENSILYTIGYGGLVKEAFRSKLKKRGIKTIVDIRINPYSFLNRFQRFRNFNETTDCIQNTVCGVGVNYVSLIELGNLFKEYDDWKYRYREFLCVAGTLLVKPLLDLEEPICLMCSEVDYRRCHRGILADFLVEKGYFSDVVHID